MLKVAVDSTGVANLNFARSYPVLAPDKFEAISRALASEEDDASDVQLVLFPLDAPFPSGEPDEEEIGLAAISLRRLLRSGRDFAMGPVEIDSPQVGKCGTVMCEIVAVEALRTVQLQL